MERSREYSRQRTQPDASVTILNLFWQFSRQAQIEQYFFSLPTEALRRATFPLRSSADTLSRHGFEVKKFDDEKSLDNHPLFIYPEPQPLTSSKEGTVTMKKTISALIILLMFLVPVGGGASYLIRLKNGGQLATSLYWFEGKWIFFYYAGGIAGMEKDLISKIEKSDRETVSPVEPEPVPVKTEEETGTKTETASTTVEGKKDDRFMREFSLLKERAKDAGRMTTEELYKFSDDLIGFRDKVLGNRVGHIYTDELLEIYAILDKIEDTIKARGQ